MASHGYKQTIVQPQSTFKFPFFFLVCELVLSKIQTGVSVNECALLLSEASYSSERVVNN